MKKHEKILLILTAVLILTLALINLSPRGGNELKKYSYTKALCNKTTCMDYKVNCTGKKVTSMDPTGFSIQNFNKNNSSQNETLCS